MHRNIIVRLVTYYLAVVLLLSALFYAFPALGRYVAAERARQVCARGWPARIVIGIDVEVAVDDLARQDLVARADDLDAHGTSGTGFRRPRRPTNTAQTATVCSTAIP